MSEKKISSVRLQDIAQAYGQSATLMAAVELGLFTQVSRGAETVSKIAEALGIHPTNAERLVTMCTAMELLIREDGQYRNAPDVERFLVEDNPSYAGAWMLFTKNSWNQWRTLTDHLKVKDLKLMGPIEDITVEGARQYHQATYSIGMGAGRRFAKYVDLTKRKKILDLGGGSGAYCINAVQKYPHLQAVVFDLPPVVEVTQEFIAQNEVSDKVATLAGNFISDAFPTDADVVIMASNLPMYGPEVIQKVVQKAFDALLPGGEMHLIGETIYSDRSGPIGPAFWGIREAIEDTMGVAHSEVDCLGYFQKAGFTKVQALPFIEGSLSRIYGVKPK